MNISPERRFTRGTRKFTTAHQVLHEDGLPATVRTPNVGITTAFESTKPPNEGTSFVSKRSHYYSLRKREASKRSTSLLLFNWHLKGICLTIHMWTPSFVTLQTNNRINNRSVNGTEGETVEAGSGL